MTKPSTIYKLSLLALTCLLQVCGGARCPLLECWLVQEKAGRGGLSAPANQEKSLLHIRTDASGLRDAPPVAPSDISPEHIFSIYDPAGTLCDASLDAPSGSLEKPQCELNPFLPQPSSLSWVEPLTASGLSPAYLDARWLSASTQGLGRKLALSTITRAPKDSNQHDVILSVRSRTVSVQARLGQPVLLDCGYWADPDSPLTKEGFAVEWRYQFRGRGHMVLAYDGKTDRLAEGRDEAAMLDFEALHRHGNASLILQEAKVKHSGTYICTVHLPYLLAQLTLELEIVEPPTLTIHPSPLPLTAPGQTLTVYCEASGFAPHSLELGWEIRGADGKRRALEGSVTGHRQAWDGTFSQTAKLELHTSTPELGRGGQLSCVAQHPGGSPRATVQLDIIGFSTPSIEDSMAMVGVALVLYGLIKFVSWTFTRTGSDDADEVKKEK